MKPVMIICNSLGTGGAEKQTVALANGLHRMGRQVIIIYLYNSHELLSELDPEIQKATFYMARNSYLDFSIIKQIRRLARKHSISSILAVNQLPLVYAVLARGFVFSINIFAGFHTTKLIPGDIFKFYANGWWFFKFATKVIYVCNAQKKYWANRGLHLFGRATYIYNGIDANKFNVPDTELGKACRTNLSIPEEALCLASIAVLRPEKNHAAMIEALSRVVDQGIDAYILCVGDGPERAEIETLSSRLGIGERVKMIGRVQDVRPYIAAADASLILSTSETFSMAVLESIGCGCPVIAYDIGGIAEQIAVNGIGKVIQQGDLNGIVSAIISLKEWRSQAVTLHDYIKKTFSDTRMIDSYNRIL